jgi:hypothetical protein
MTTCWKSGYFQGYPNYAINEVYVHSIFSVQIIYREVSTMAQIELIFLA